MPYYTPPRSPYAAYFMPLSPLPTVKVETKAPSSYALYLQGVRTETEQAFAINRGEIETLEKGDYIRKTKRIFTETGETEVEVIELAIEDNSTIELDDDEPNDRPSYEDNTQAQNEETLRRNAEANQYTTREYDDHPVYYEEPVYETAPNYDTSNREDPVYRPENSAPPVQYEESTEETQPVDEPEVREPTWYELRDLEETGGYAGDGAGYTSGGDEPFVVSHGGDSYWA